MGTPYEVTEKHLPGLGKKTIRLDNRDLGFSFDKETLEDGTVIGQHISRGGMFSLDNLHPTVVGYGALAKELVTAIDRTEEPLSEATKAYATPETAYARFVGRPRNTDGNVLHRVDSNLASRTQWLQAGFDFQTYLRGSRGADCWPRRPGVLGAPPTDKPVPMPDKPFRNAPEMP